MTKAAVRGEEVVRVHQLDHEPSMVARRREHPVHRTPVILQSGGRGIVRGSQLMTPRWFWGG